jgi:putative nucleotidyltransferase with HDIG domain
MFRKIKIPETPHEKSALKIVKVLKDSGHSAYWVGGCVRNRILGLPSDDIDVTTSATPEEISRLFPRTISVGAKFGVMIVLDEDIQTEVATYRSDGAYLDGRRPSEVHFSDPENDALRRDFTINSLFWDPLTGELLDFVNGRRDIEKKIIRCIGKAEKRLQEDALRLMRAIRFSARFSFPIEENTWKAICSNHKRIRKISADRIREELVKIIRGPNRAYALDLLERSLLLGEILPEIQALKGVKQPKEFHPEGDCFQHTKISLEMLRNPSHTLSMGCLLHDVGKPPTFEETDRIRFKNHSRTGEKIADEICLRLNFSNADRQKITDLVGRHMHFISVKDMKLSTLKKFLSHPNIEEDLELHRADCISSHGKLDNYNFCIEKLKELRSEEKEIIPPPLLSGKDLIKLGYKPGPIFKEILNRIQDAQLEGEITTSEEALKLARSEFSSKF